MQKQSASIREGRCPSCGKCTSFSHTGEQRWPLRAAQAAGINPVVQLWTCNSCHSTFSENTLS